MKLKQTNTTNKWIGETRIKRTNVKSPECIKVTHFEVLPGLWTALQQQQEHSEGILHNGAKNGTKRNEMRKILFKKQNMHEINILANLCCDIDFEDFSHDFKRKLGIVKNNNINEKALWHSYEIINNFLMKIIN